MKQFENYEFTNLFDLNPLRIDRDIVFSLIFAQSDWKITWFAFFARLLQTAVTQRIMSFDKKQYINCIKVNIEQTVLLRMQTSEISANYSNIIHIDIIGPISHEGYKNIQYLLMLVDDTTHWVSLLKL